MRYKYRFPPNKRAKLLTIDAQIQKITEEVLELLQAKDSMNFIEEAWDIIWATESLLRKLNSEKVTVGYFDVLNKARMRDDVDELTHANRYIYRD